MECDVSRKSGERSKQKNSKRVRPTPERGIRHRQRSRGPNTHSPGGYLENGQYRGARSRYTIIQLRTFIQVDLDTSRVPSIDRITSGDLDFASWDPHMTRRIMCSAALGVNSEEIGVSSTNYASRVSQSIYPIPVSLNSVYHLLGLKPSMLINSRKRNHS